MSRQLTAREVSDIARTSTTPNNIPRSVRQIDASIATSMLAGKVVPLAAFPLLREDTLRNSIMHAKVALMESAKVIKNPVQCRFQVWFIPFLAFERFNGGRDEFDRSYKKVAIADGASVTPFFMSRVMGSVGSSEIMKSLGLHANPGETINTVYEEAYNVMYNFRLRNRSETLYQSQKVNSLTNTALQPAFWQHGQYKYVVPDWDDLASEGSVDLTFTNPKALVEGLSMYGPALGAQGAADASTIRSKGDQAAWTGKDALGAGEGRANAGIVARTIADVSVPAGKVLDVYANMQSAGIKISLANIELAKKTQWYAEIKAQFEGIPDQWVIDMLMEGISVPDYMWKQPIKMADVTEIFGIQKRWATDGANLTDSVVNGYSVSSLDLAMPRSPTGGIVMVTAEILPEQLFERAADPLLFITDPDKLPNAMRDDLDPQKAERISNRQVDVAHSSPTGLFGYGPTNWPWQQPMIRIGGKWFKSAPSTVFNEERQNFWTVEVANPALGTDFMIAKTFNQLPFVVTNQDIAEIEIEGTAIIEGNTVFGPALLENDNAYAEVLAKVDQTRIVKGV